MIVLRLLPVILSTLLFTAHLMRFNGFPLAIVVITLLLTLFIRKSRIIRLWQILLALAALKWVIIAIELIHMRIAFDMPYARLTIILIFVIIFNLFTVFWLQNKKIRLFYQGRTEGIEVYGIWYMGIWYIVSLAFGLLKSGKISSRFADWKAAILSGSLYPSCPVSDISGKSGLNLTAGCP